jgi:hypothetical protein
MLKQVLTEMAREPIHSHAELARRLDISEGLLDQMLLDLARKDYVTQVNFEECDLEKCDACPLGGNCIQTKSVRANSLGQRWILTEKGRRAATEP